eukprot:GHVS01043222.1.p1 GENE.GHVS01043222.1~~GHVS01043222.1.p1  ORF type:complete len:545 (+),score=27.16 GHVS01043222.1:200-1636(+)
MAQPDRETVQDETRGSAVNGGAPNKTFIKWTVGSKEVTSTEGHFALSKAQQDFSAMFILMVSVAGAPKKQINFCKAQFKVLDGTIIWEVPAAAFPDGTEAYFGISKEGCEAIWANPFGVSLVITYGLAPDFKELTSTLSVLTGDPPIDYDTNTGIHFHSIRTGAIVYRPLFVVPIPHSQVFSQLEQSGANYDSFQVFSPLKPSDATCPLQLMFTNIDIKQCISNYNTAMKTAYTTMGPSISVQIGGVAETTVPYEVGGYVATKNECPEKAYLLVCRPTSGNYFPYDRLKEILDAVKPVWMEVATVFVFGLIRFTGELAYRESISVIMGLTQKTKPDRRIQWTIAIDSHRGTLSQANADRLAMFILVVRFHGASKQRGICNKAVFRVPNIGNISATRLDTNKIDASGEPDAFFGFKEEQLRAILWKPAGVTFEIEYSMPPDNNVLTGAFSVCTDPCSSDGIPAAKIQVGGIFVVPLWNN